MRIHWLKPDGATGTACGLGGIVSERTPDVTCQACIELAAREDRLVRVRASKRREAQALADPWQDVRGREF